MAPSKKKAVKKKGKASGKKTAKKVTKPVAKKTAKPAPKKKAAAAKKSIAPRPKAAGAKQDKFTVKARELKVQLSPLDDRLLVQTESASEMTAGGLYIPASVTERPQRGRVLAKGRGRKNKKGQVRPLDVSVGDVVLFPQFAGTAVQMDGHELLILREEEVLGIVTR